MKKYIFAGVAVAVFAVSVLLISQQATKSSMVEADDLAGLTPQEAFSAALTNMQSAKTGSFSAKILLEPIMEKGTSAKKPDSLTAHYSGSVDATDPTSPKLMFAFDATIPMETGMPEGVSGTIDAEARAFKTSAYVKLNKMPALMDFTPILNSWIKIDLTDITKQLGMAPTTTALDPALMAQFRTDFNSANIIKINATYDDEAVGGVSTSHYGWIIDKKAVIAFIPKYQAFVKSVGASQSASMDKMMADAALQLATVPAEEYPSGDIWLTKSNPTIAEIKFEKTIPVPAASTVSTPGVTGAHVVMSLFFTDMNKPVTITEPTTSITFEEAYDKLMKSPPGTGTAELFVQARNNQRSSDLNSILNAIGQNMASNRGIFTCEVGPLPSTAMNMSSPGAYNTMARAKGYDIASCLVPEYLPSMPFDPTAKTGANQNPAYWTSATNYNTEYVVSQTGGSMGKVTVSAPSAELGVKITVTR